MNNNEWQIMLPGGDIITPDMFTKEAIEETDNETLGYRNEELGRATSFKRKTDSAIKSRLDAGQKFNHYEYSEKAKQTTVYTDRADDEQVKYDLVNKFGWGVVQLKPIEELQKMHGQVIEPDLESITEIEEKITKRISMK